MAVEEFLRRLGCSQAYPCLQIADQRSIQMLGFNFISRLFAYRRLTHCLSRTLSAFSRFLREYLQKVVKADQCAQSVDNIDIAADYTEHLIAKLGATLKCI